MIPGRIVDLLVITGVAAAATFALSVGMNPRDDRSVHRSATHHVVGRFPVEYFTMGH